MNIEVPPFLTILTNISYTSPIGLGCITFSNKVVYLGWRGVNRINILMIKVCEIKIFNYRIISILQQIQWTILLWNQNDSVDLGWMGEDRKNTLIIIKVWEIKIFNYRIISILQQIQWTILLWIKMIPSIDNNGQSSLLLPFSRKLRTIILFFDT